MNSFFRWASILIAIGVLAGAAVYFVWLRVPDAPDGLTNGVLNGSPAAVATPVETTLTVSTPAAQMLVTPEPRQAIVIMPPPADSEPGPTAADLPSTPAEGDLDLAEPARAEIAASPLVPVVEQPETDFDGDDRLPASSVESDTGNVAAPDSSVESAGLAPSDVAQDAIAPNTIVQDTATQDATPAPPPAATAQESDAASRLRPSDVRPPDSLAFGISTPEIRAQLVVPPVVTGIVGGEEASAFLPTPTPDAAATLDREPVSLPAAIQLYRAPDPDAALIDATVQRQAIDIVARDTTGRWYLLVDGLWIQADAVGNPPTQLPLVVPTITPTPTNTGMPTPTEEPEPPTPEPSTPTPTPTSLDFPVCDCTPDAYACVTHSFRVRAEAQACFEYCFRMTGRDVHNLDPDGNGLACESLPE